MEARFSLAIQLYSVTAPGSSSTLPETKSEEELFAEAIMALDANNGALFDSVQAALATGSSDLEIERHLLPPSAPK